MNYKLKLMQILDCFGEEEGTLYSDSWRKYGISEKEQEQIEKEYNKYFDNKYDDKKE